MEVDQDSGDMDGSEKLVDPSEKKKLECTPKIIIFITIGNLIFIALNIIFIHLYHYNKTNYMTSIMNDYVKDLNKMAITDKRINHLIKTENDEESKYQKLVDLQKLVLNATYEFLKNKGFDSLLKEMDNKTFAHVLPKYIENPAEPISFIEDLYRVLTQEEDWRIYQLMDNYDLKTINDAIHEKTGDKYIEQLKTIILYGLIDLPLQVLYFSKNETIKEEYIKAIKTKLNPGTINNIINTKMQDYKKDTNDVLMVLGCDQEEEIKRINKTIPDTIINLVNTGLRMSSTENERKNLKENFEKYYLGDSYGNLMKNCLEENEVYEEFIKEGRQLIEGEYTDEKIEKIHELFKNKSFSVETANTVINYIKLGVSNDNIKIIRLNGKQSNDDIKYNTSDVFILYNLHDTDNTTEDKTNRATTYSNAQAIKYLKRECPNFLTDEQYNNTILISSLEDAERQLEAFNIASNIIKMKDVQNKIMRWDQVLWYKDGEENLNGNQTIEIMLETLVKSYHLYSEKCGMNNDSLAGIYINLIEKYQNISE